MDDSEVKTLAKDMTHLSMFGDIPSWLRMADFIIPFRCAEVNPSSSISSSTLTEYERALLQMSSAVLNSGMPDLTSEYQRILAQPSVSSPDVEVGNGIAKVDGCKNPEDSFPRWERFALHCKVASSEVNDLTQVLICPALGGRFALPIARHGNSSSDIDPSLWAFVDLTVMQHFCYCSGLKALHFRSPGDGTLQLWRDLMDHLIQKPLSSFSFAEIVGTLAFRRTVGLFLNVFPYLSDDKGLECLHTTHQSRQSIALFRTWGTALKSGVENPGGNWQKAMEETGYGPWLFEE